MDINEKLRSLTPEQANKLAGHLNSCYPDKKKPAPAKMQKRQNRSLLRKHPFPRKKEKFPKLIRPSSGNPYDPLSCRSADR